VQDFTDAIRAESYSRFNEFDELIFRADSVLTEQKSLQQESREYAMNNGKEHSSSQETPSVSESKGRGWMKLGLFGLLVCLAVVLYTQFGHLLSLEVLSHQESRLREFQQQSPLLVYALAFAVYVAVTGLSLPGATVLTLMFGWYFGFLRGILLVSVASTTGATFAFLVSRFLFRESMRSRFGDRLNKFNQSLEREGPFFLFTLRLIPAVPFFVINTVMGLTPIKTSTFWWVSQVGMLPGTAIYVYAASTVPNLTVLAEKGLGSAFTPSQLTQIFVAFVMLGSFPWIVRSLLAIASRKQIIPEVEAETRSSNS